MNQEQTQNYFAQKEKMKTVKQARVRVGLSWLLHMFTIPPVVSLVYSIKTENYVPVLAATGVAVVSAPLALIDLGLTLAIAPPVTSAVLIGNAASSSRRKLGIFEPEEADMMAFSSFKPNPEVVVNNVVNNTKTEEGEVS